MSQHFYYFYDTRKYCEDAIHIGIYYNMQVEKYVYINGFRKNQLEIVDFLVDFLHTDTITGFGPFYTKTLRRKVNRIRANVRYHA